MRGRRSAQAVPRHSLTRMLARRLRVWPRQPGTRAASGPALGALRPLCEELADGPSDIGTRKRGPEPKNAAGGAPRGERVSQTRTAPHTRGLLVRLAALRSPHVREGEESEEGAARAPPQAGGGALAV